MKAETLNKYFAKADILLAKLDEKVWPEIHAYLTSLLCYQEKPESLFQISVALMNCDKPKDFSEECVKYITELLEVEIEEGNADAMNDLGAHYYNGERGFEQSYDKAFHFFNMAAENGSRLAQENLGYCYYYGRVGEPDYEKAFHYFALGAFDGHLVSLYKIGDMYLNGYYVEKNEQEAFLIYMHCHNLMTEKAEYYAAGPVYLRLGRMFLNGIGTVANAKAALICFQKAESYLYDMVSGGDELYFSSLEDSVKGQVAARKFLDEALTKI